jgi:hypothetical protein
MGIKKKSTGVDFRNILIKKAFENIKQTDPLLHKHLIRAFKDILENAFCGIQISKHLIPKEYACNNLWKYNLPDAWRLIYTLKSPNKVEIISVVLDWMNHKDYSRKFKY